MTMLRDSRRIKTDSCCVIFIAPGTNYCDHICGSHTPWGHDLYKCMTPVIQGPLIHPYKYPTVGHCYLSVSREPWSRNDTDKTHNLQKTHCSLLIRNCRQKPVSSVIFFPRRGRQKAFCRSVRNETLLVCEIYTPISIIYFMTQHFK